VTNVIQFTLVAVALLQLVVKKFEWVRDAYKTNGIHASAIQPDLVASGGEPPYISSDQ
jgi:hypothetical protein